MNGRPATSRNLRSAANCENISHCKNDNDNVSQGVRLYGLRFGASSCNTAELDREERFKWNDE